MTSRGWQLSPSCTPIHRYGGKAAQALAYAILKHEYLWSATDRAIVQQWPKGMSGRKRIIAGLARSMSDSFTGSCFDDNKCKCVCSHVQVKLQPQLDPHKSMCWLLHADFTKSSCCKQCHLTELNGSQAW